MTVEIVFDRSLVQLDTLGGHRTFEQHDGGGDQVHEVR